MDICRNGAETHHFLHFGSSKNIDNDVKNPKSSGIADNNPKSILQSDTVGGTPRIYTEKKIFPPKNDGWCGIPISSSVLDITRLRAVLSKIQ